jgi:hypothetical protein
MKPKPTLHAAVLAAFLGLASAAPAAEAPEPAPALTTAQWRADLQFVARELPKRHPEPWRFTPQSKFEAAVADLNSRLPNLDADQAYVGLAEIAVMMGDGHTFLAFPADAADLPIRFARFGEDYRVTAADSADATALGARVIAIQGIPIADALQGAWAMTPGDENPPWREVNALSFLHQGVALHGLGITPDRRRARFTFATDDGRRFDLDVAASPPGAKVDFIQASRAQPLSRGHPGEGFWCEELSQARTVYCAFHSYQDLGKRTREMFALIDRVHPEKLVIDMRTNGGGDYFVGLFNLVDPLAKRQDLNRKGHLFVLIGPQTFSAAMSNAAHFRYRTQAILVGREIGEKPNSWQERQSVKLPNSGLVLNYSTKWYAFVPEGAENAIRPDHQVAASWPDFVAGRDPALDWVLSYGAD